MAAPAAVRSRRWLLAAGRRAHRWSAFGLRLGNPPQLLDLDPPSRKLVSGGLGSAAGLRPDSRRNPITLLLHSRALLTNAAPDGGKYALDDSAAGVKNHGLASNEDQDSLEGTAGNEHHQEVPLKAELEDPHSAQEEEVLGDLESLRILMSKLSTSLLIMGTVQILSSIYIAYTGYAAGKLFLRLALFMVVLPLSLAFLLPVRSLKRLVLRLDEVVKEGPEAASKLSTLLHGGVRDGISSYFRKTNVVTSLSALVLLLASMFEMFYPYVAGTIVEAGDKLERLAREDVASSSKSQLERR